MTLFGQTLDGQQIFGLVSLLTALAFWIVVARRNRSASRDLDARLLERQREKDGTRGADAGQDASKEGWAAATDKPGPSRGPWG